MKIKICRVTEYAKYLYETFAFTCMQINYIQKAMMARHLF